MSGRSTLPLNLERLHDILRTASSLIGEGVVMIDPDDPDWDHDLSIHRIIQGDLLLGVVLGAIEAFQDGGEG